MALFISYFFHVEQRSSMLYTYSTGLESEVGATIPSKAFRIFFGSTRRILFEI